MVYIDHYVDANKPHMCYNITAFILNFQLSFQLFSIFSAFWNYVGRNFIRGIVLLNTIRALEILG